MSDGTGLLDRCLISIPLSLQILDEEVDESTEYLDNNNFPSISQIYQLLYNSLDAAHPIQFYFSREAQR